MTCQHTIKSGPRKGTLCGEKAVQIHHMNHLCMKHKVSNPTFCEYTTYFEQILKSDQVALDANRLEMLNGYINIRVFGNPLVFMAHLPPLETQHFTKMSLAQEIIKAVYYLQSRPDMYLNVPTNKNLYFDRIVYNEMHSIFECNIQQTFS